MSPLTPTQLAVLRYVADGESSPSIAQKIARSQRGARGQYADLRRKLGARTLAHAVSIAYKKGILTA